MVHLSRAFGDAIGDESGALLGRFIGKNLAGLGNGIGIVRVTMFPDLALRKLGKVQIPSPETVRPTPEGTEDAVRRAHEDENRRPDGRGGDSCTAACRLVEVSHQVEVVDVHLAGFVSLMEFA